jgi:hypothetical protein
MVDFAIRRDQRGVNNTLIGLTLFALVFAINRSGRERLKVREVLDT